MANIPEGHIDPDVVTVGIITFNDILSEKEVYPRPSFKSIGECKIEAYAGEGSVPHFHMSSLNGEFSSCVCIYSNNYFSHGGKYRDKLNTSQRKRFNSLLKQQDPVNGLTMWQQIEFLWRTMNPECKFPKNRMVKIQPDYTTMENYKDS